MLAQPIPVVLHILLLTHPSARSTETECEPGICVKYLVLDLCCSTVEGDHFRGLQVRSIQDKDRCGGCGVEIILI